MIVISILDLHIYWYLFLSWICIFPPDNLEPIQTMLKAWFILLENFIRKVYCWFGLQKAGLRSLYNVLSSTILILSSLIEWFLSFSLSFFVSHLWYRLSKGDFLSVDCSCYWIIFSTAWKQFFPLLWDQPQFFVTSSVLKSLIQNVSELQLIDLAFV